MVSEQKFLDDFAHNMTEKSMNLMIKLVGVFMGEVAPPKKFCLPENDVCYPSWALDVSCRRHVAVLQSLFPCKFLLIFRASFL